MPRRDDELADLLDRLGRRRISLTIDDVAAVVGDALKKQKRDLLGHMQRLFTLERIQSSAPQNETRHRNLHARLVVVESAIRSLQRERSR